MARCVFRTRVVNSNNRAVLAAARQQEAPVQRTLVSSNKVSVRSFSMPRPDHVNYDAIDESNEETSSLADIQETPDGRGLGVFALQDLKKGQRVFRSKASPGTFEQDAHSVQIGWDKHVMMDLPSILVNHSCKANLGVQPNEFGAYDFYALEAIPPKTELVWDYETTEYEISGFACSCGAPKCRGVVKGFRHHGDKVLEAYGEDFISPYLLK